MAAKNSSRQGGKSTDNNGPKRDRKSRRNVIVMAGLLSSLSLTSVLLLALAPAPLTPDHGPLVALDQYEKVFDTRIPFSDHWRYIYIHHSKSRSGKAGMDDHFVIGNGDGSTDGSIQLGQFWLNQQAARPSGAQVSNDCITICLVGDFDQHAPTSLQLDRLEGLVKAIQLKLGIDAAGVIISDAPASPAGIGRHFPKAAFDQRLRR
jgi:hypothetical protein